MESMDPHAPILCVGVTPAIQKILRLDGLTVGEVNRATSAVQATAGKATNVCRVLTALDVPGLLIGFRGGDAGEIFLKALSAEGLASALVAAPGETRTCTTLIDEKTGRVTELVEEAEEPGETAWGGLLDLIAGQLARASCLIISGKLPRHSPVDTYRRIAAGAREAGVPWMIDSQGEALVEALSERPRLAQLNASELAASVDGPDLEARAESLLASGAEWLLVTEGARAARLFGPGESWRIEVPRVRALNTIGSGDSTLAGIAARLRDGDPVPRAVTFGLACGSANAMTLTPGSVDPAEAARLAATISAIRV